MFWFGYISGSLVPRPVWAGYHWVTHAVTATPPGQLSQFVTGWLGWSKSSWSPGQPFPTISGPRTASQSPKPVVDVPAAYGFMPGAPWSGYQMPSQLETLPWVYRSLMHDAALALGIRWDSGYPYFDVPQVEPSRQVVVTVPPSKPRLS